MENFLIEHVDFMGQGVSKINDKIIFIPKTLPGEEGLCEIVAKRKGVHFAKVLKITKKSTKRITPECPHFDECSGCHFLHTSYDEEIQTKLSNFKFMTKRLSFKNDIIVHKSEERFDYRNRIQMHYDKKGEIGFHKKSAKEILSVPNCKLPLLDIQKILQKIYSDTQVFLKENDQSNKSGHFEIYKGNLFFNQRYSAGGFTQVNQKMNQECHKIINNAILNSKTPRNSHVVDLFGGSGNLSENLSEHKVTVIDSTPKKFISLKDHQNYYECNVYKDKNFLNYLRKLPDAHALIIDPPRSGYKDFAKAIEALGPKTIIYMSCNPPTMVRDITTISQNYNLDEIHLIDLFPSTFHFEAITVLSKK